MENVSFINVESFGITTAHAIIDNGDGSSTSMLKSTYDKMIAKQDEASTL